MILALILFLLIPTKTFAIDEFNTLEQINYQFNINNSCQVEEKVTITNNFSQIYLKEYQINLNQKDVSNVKAYDSAGNILKQVIQNQDQYSILLKFNQPQVGKNQQTIFHLAYTVDNCSVKKGKTWEIVLPKFIKTSSNHQIEMKLSVPTSYGDLSSTTAKGYTEHIQSNNHLYNFTLANDQTPIIFIFGNHQLFDFSIDYHLENTSNFPINTQIALPPDTDYQIVKYSQINPPPLVVKSDTDGNWMATYSVNPNTKLTINATGQVKIIQPKHQSISINQDVFTASKNFWPTDSPVISSVTKNLTTPKSIYQFVVNYLNYDYNRFNTAKRQGALFAIDNPQNALCTEFTDLFVTLARNKKIPAREIQGYAYSQDNKIKPINPNSDILHAWPQYYDQSKQYWISVDPTWEKTTNGIDYFSDLDLNHFTFVIHGQESDYPSPPGAYKNNQNIKTVNVVFSQEELNIPLIQATVYQKNNQLIVRNPNLQSLNNIKINNQTISLPPLGEFMLNTKIPFYQLTQTFTISSDEAPTATSAVNNQYSGIFPIIIIGLAIITLSFFGIILLSSLKHEKNS